VLLISKFYNDVYYSNTYIANFNGVSTQLLNEIERVYAKMLDYQLFVSEEQYDWYMQGLHFHSFQEQAQL
jgi:hypothetical protein